MFLLRMRMVPSSEEVELEHQPHAGFSGPIPGESPLTPVEAQNIKQVAPPAPDDVVLGKQVCKIVRIEPGQRNLLLRATVTEGII